MKYTRFSLKCSLVTNRVYYIVSTSRSSARSSRISRARTSPSSARCRCSSRSQPRSSTASARANPHLRSTSPPPTSPQSSRSTSSGLGNQQRRAPHQRSTAPPQPRQRKQRTSVSACARYKSLRTRRAPPTTRLPPKMILPLPQPSP